MRRGSLEGNENARDRYITVVTDLNGYVNFTMESLARAKHDALRVARWRLSRGVEDVEHGVSCGRCGARAWLETAENGSLILLEPDGSPHRDVCPHAGKPPLLALELIREAARPDARSQQDWQTAAVHIETHREAFASASREPDAEGDETDPDALASALANAATKECWDVLQEGKAVLRRHEAMTRDSEWMHNSTLEEAWALASSVEAVEARFETVAPDFYALLKTLEKLHRKISVTVRTARAAPHEPAPPLRKDTARDEGNACSEEVG